ncbi:hypothetical protein M885DRAFT_557611 [Pelagophyceae sp. CCMP2097]|nr:hypothetical protein M885DRAFT_557611 [Pelagophyceae sp. CCMP2097]
MPLFAAPIPEQPGNNGFAAALAAADSRPDDLRPDDSRPDDCRRVSADAERDEMIARARVVARKVWYLRHGALCLHPRKCPLGPCATAVGLVTHMRACGAIVEPTRGCRSPACAHAARLLHHPRTCKAPDCAVCSLVRQAGTSGKGLVLSRDYVARPDASLAADAAAPAEAPEASPTKRRARAYSECALGSPVAFAKDSDGFAIPAPRAIARKRTWSVIQWATMADEGTPKNGLVPDHAGLGPGGAHVVEDDMFMQPQ